MRWAWMFHAFSNECFHGRWWKALKCFVSFNRRQKRYQWIWIFVLCHWFAWSRHIYLNQIPQFLMKSWKNLLYFDRNDTVNLIIHKTHACATGKLSKHGNKSLPRSYFHSYAFNVLMLSVLFFSVNKKQFLCYNIRCVVSQGNSGVAEGTTSCFSHHLLPRERFLNDIRFFTFSLVTFSSLTFFIFEAEPLNLLQSVKVKSSTGGVRKGEFFFSSALNLKNKLKTNKERKHDKYFWR